MTSPALHTPLAAPLRHQPTTAKPQIAALLVRDPPPKEITAQVSLSHSTVERLPKATAEKVSCPPHMPRHILVHAVLPAGQLPSSEAPRGVRRHGLKHSAGVSEPTQLVRCGSARELLDAEHTLDTAGAR
ncbi:hypothetical protein [Streptomyces murinus]|uniref:hypothetical protein n=1 Tax=Streptomyces murinus TaxID=33900 RepID=UPI0036E15585